MMPPYDGYRRTFLKDAAFAASGLLLAGVTSSTARGQASQPLPGTRKEDATKEISPAEDLMREHGVLDRILLVYEEAVRRIDGQSELSPEPLTKAAELVGRFIQDYHEKLEEDHLFPRFDKAGKMVELVMALRMQHLAVRWLTDEIRRRANAATLKDLAERHKLVESLQAFARMYRPHKAREDTVLFPAFHALVAPAEYDALGAAFEDKEHALFGPDGFEKVVDEVAAIEKSLGIYELAQFTPRP